MADSKWITLLNLNPKFYVIVGIFTTVAAQIFLKRAGASVVLKSTWLFLMFLSLGFYSISFLSYYIALKHFDISTIQPIMMVSIVGIIAVYGFAVGENFTYLKASGIILAALSIFLITKS